jgi:hypothetical protein
MRSLHLGQVPISISSDGIADGMASRGALYTSREDP